MICVTGALCLPGWWGALVGGATGLAAGSFLGALLSRWPRAEQVRAGRSRCDACGAQLAWFELVPVVSFALLAGRCRRCGATIDPALVLMELACAVAGAWLVATDRPGAALLAWVLIALALFDARHLWLPDRLVALLAAIALVIAPWEEGMGLALRLAGGMAGFASLWAVARGFRLVTGRDGLGGGDPKLFGALGLWFGPFAMAPLLVLACLIGLVDAAARHVRSGGGGDRQLPLGTYIAVAAMAFAVLGPDQIPVFDWAG